MPTFEERIDSSGRRRYRALIRIKGNPTQSATFDRLTDARRWAQQIESEMKSGRYFGKAQARKRTVGEMIDKYMAEVLPAKGTSIIRVQTTELLWWKDRLGHLFLSDAIPSEIASARDDLARGITSSGKPRSAGTVTHYLAAISHCFSIAVKEWGWLDDSPLRKVSKPKQDPGRVRFLSDLERDRLLIECRASSSEKLYAVVVLALSTGMRKGEILGMSWDRVDLQREVLYLLPEHTKNKEARAVPIVVKDKETLLTLSQTRRTDTELVFPAPSGEGKAAKPIDIRSAWETAVRRAELRDSRFHDLRHTAASYLAMNGATLAEIAEVLGHKTLSMVKRYSHLTEAHTSKVVERMNQAMFGN